jgi:hypothetical protein
VFPALLLPLLLVLGGSPRVPTDVQLAGATTRVHQSAPEVEEDEDDEEDALTEEEPAPRRPALPAPWSPRLRPARLVAGTFLLVLIPAGLLFSSVAVAAALITIALGYPLVLLSMSGTMVFVALAAGFQALLVMAAVPIVAFLSAGAAVGVARRTAPKPAMLRRTLLALVPQAAFGAGGVALVGVLVAANLGMTGFFLQKMWEGRRANLTGTTPRAINEGGSLVLYACGFATTSWCLVLPLAHAGAACLQGAGITAGAAATAWDARNDVDEPPSPDKPAPQPVVPLPPIPPLDAEEQTPAPPRP